MPILAIIWQYRQLIAEVMGCLVVATIIWWFGFHVPAENKKLKAEIVQKDQTILAGQKAVTLLDDIQEGKVKIDEQVQAQLTSAHHAIFKHHTSSIFLRAGRLSLPPVRPGKITR